MNPTEPLPVTDPLPPLAGVRELAEYEAGSPELAIANANALVRDWCGWHIAPTVTETLTVDGSGEHILMLPTLRLLAVHSVAEHGVAVELARVRWSRAGYLHRGHRWTRRENSVQVQVTHGWPMVPPVVTGVVLGIAKRAKDTPATTVKAHTAGPFSEQLTVAADGSIGGINLTVAERDQLGPYRVVPVA
ncbi:hypothetical protein [Nocardia sp. NPDC051570]|uniref:hypothetical protein n=1 Tax=Nocardia sp. NPDC051570 TaxID=3364324 RepID=UPI0037B2A4BD